MLDPFASLRLAGRTALVTDARREIGRAISPGLSGAGARLAIHHAGTVEEGSDAIAVVQEIQRMGGGRLRAVRISSRMTPVSVLLPPSPPGRELISWY
jgi:NAD(P)-dependent dehydrogenase (short-subunit alcohol dehydrogenase family)